MHNKIEIYLQMIPIILVIYILSTWTFDKIFWFHNIFWMIYFLTALILTSLFYILCFKHSNPVNNVLLRVSRIFTYIIIYKIMIFAFVVYKSSLYFIKIKTKGLSICDCVFVEYIYKLFFVKNMINSFCVLL